MLIVLCGGEGNMTLNLSPGEGGGTAIYGLNRCVLLGRVWFSSSLDR